MDNELIVTEYNTEDLSFQDEYKTTLKDDGWRPLSVSLGLTVLIIGDDQNEGFYVLDLKSKKFTFNVHLNDRYSNPI